MAMITQQFSYPDQYASGVTEEMLKADVILPAYDIFLLAMDTMRAHGVMWDLNDLYVDMEHALAAFNGLVKLTPQETLVGAITNLSPTRDLIRRALVSGIFPYIYKLMPDPTENTWMIADICIVKMVGRYDYHIEVLLKKIA